MIALSNETPSLDFMLNELEKAVKLEPKLDYMTKYQELYKQKYEGL